MKKGLKVMIILLTFFTVKVNADAYYTNSNGLEFDEFQYNAMVDILDEEKVADMTQKEYNHFNVANMKEGNFEYTTKEYETRATPQTGGIQPYGFYETSSKKLTVSKGCTTSFCLITTTLVWKKVPSVTSYDVIGMRLANTTFYDDYNDVTIKDGGVVTSNYSGKKRTSEGVGIALKISNQIDYATLSVRVKPTSNGTVYGSYQHAVTTVTLSKALNFTFSGTGYGSVFVWPSSYGRIYDQMGGTSVDLA